MEAPMLKAKDIMTREVITVKQDTPIFESLELFLKNDITGIPVVEDDMTLVGILTEKDVLRLFYAQEDEGEKTVNYFMTPSVINFDENESLQDVCDCLMTNPFRRIPVTSKGKVVGVISRPDIIRHILRSRGGSGIAS